MFFKTINVRGRLLDLQNQVDTQNAKCSSLSEFRFKSHDQYFLTHCACQTQLCSLLPMHFTFEDFNSICFTANTSVWYTTIAMFSGGKNNKTCLATPAKRGFQHIGTRVGTRRQRLRLSDSHILEGSEHENRMSSDACEKSF